MIIDNNGQDIDICDRCQFIGHGTNELIFLNNNSAICYNCLKNLYFDNFKSSIKTEIEIKRIIISEELRNKIFKRDEYKCVQCWSNKDLQIDHINPFSKGGITEEHNFQTLCKSCNLKKGSKKNRFSTT